MTLDFREDGQVEYMAGWVQSEGSVSLHRHFRCGV